MPTVDFSVNPEKEYDYHKLFSSIQGFNQISIFSEAMLSDKDKIIKKINNYWGEENKQITRTIENAWRKVEANYFKPVNEIIKYPW